MKTRMKATPGYEIRLDSNGWPLLLRREEKPPPSLPSDRHVLTLAQAAELLGIEPAEAVELLALHSIPRVVGWERAAIEQLGEALGAKVALPERKSA